MGFPEALELFFGDMSEFRKAATDSLDLVTKSSQKCVLFAVIFETLPGRVFASKFNPVHFLTVAISY